MAPDAISLSIPHAEPYHGVARLVVGGLAARLDLSYEHLEDLQLALVSVLERDGYVVGPEATVRFLVQPGSVGILLGPVDPDTIRTDLDHEPADGVSLRRVLETLVEDVVLEEAEGRHWLLLGKRVRTAGAEADREGA